MCAVQVERLLGRVDGLRYDTWALDAATGGHALSAMGFFLLQREGLIKPFGVRPARLVRCVGTSHMHRRHAALRGAFQSRDALVPRALPLWRGA